MEDLLKEQFETYRDLCDYGRREVMGHIKNTLQMLEKLKKRRLCADISCRIKTYEATINKLERKGYEMSIDGIKSKIKDIAGIRIITLYKDDIYLVREALVNHPKLEVIEECDYVANPKKNGYRSLHLIVSVQIPIFSETMQSQTKSVPVEIQIRTKSMDLWGEIEHELYYKNDTPCAETPEALRPMAEYFDKCDEIAIRLRDGGTKATKKQPKKSK